MLAGFDVFGGGQSQRIPGDGRDKLVSAIRTIFHARENNIIHSRARRGPDRDAATLRRWYSRLCARAPVCVCVCIDQKPCIRVFCTVKMAKKHGVYDLLRKRLLKIANTYERRRNEVPCPISDGLRLTARSVRVST